MTDVLREQHLYGSSRIALIRPNRVVATNYELDPDPLHARSDRNRKAYELTNHLGNVLTTISDLKIGQDEYMSGIADHYVPKILSASDYYPFGLEMPGRTISSESYRFALFAEAIPKLTRQLKAA